MSIRWLFFISLLFPLSLWGQPHTSHWQDWLRADITGTGPDLVFIPGYGSRGAVWDSVVFSLSDDYTCHVLTLQQFVGKRPADTALLAGILDAIQQYCQAKTKRPTLIGHSIGGFLSLHLGADYPDQFAAIVSVDALPYVAAAWSPQPQEMPPLGSAQQFMAMDSVAFMQQTYFTTRSMITDSATAVHVTYWAQKADRYAWGYLFAEFYNTDLREEVAHITVPTLSMVASGMGESATMRIWKEQYARLPNVQFAYHPTAKHFIQLDDPQWFISQLTEFLAHAAGN